MAPKQLVQVSEVVSACQCEHPKHARDYRTDLARGLRRLRAWSLGERQLSPSSATRDCCLAQLGRACSASGSTTHPTVLPSMASNISKKRKVRRASSRTSFFKALFAHYLRPTMEYERLSEPSEIEWLTICCEGELCVR